MRASCTYQLIEDQGGGYCIGADGDDFAGLVHCLQSKYGERLARVVDDQTGETLVFNGAVLDQTPPAVALPAADAGTGSPKPALHPGAAREIVVDTPDEAVIAALEALGWTREGRTAETIIHSRNSGKPKFDEADRPLTQGGRLRMRKGNRFCTVGARTTCFYDRRNGQAGDFQNIKTKDFPAVIAAAQGAAR
jgi:hypothetical protein